LLVKMNFTVVNEIFLDIFTFSHSHRRSWTGPVRARLAAESRGGEMSILSKKEMDFLSSIFFNY